MFFQREHGLLSILGEISYKIGSEKICLQESTGRFSNHTSKEMKEKKKRKKTEQNEKLIEFSCYIYRNAQEPSPFK